MLPVSTNLPQFLAVFPDQPNILVARDRTPDAVRDIMAIAARRAGEPNATGRIWVIHTHTLPTERAAFRDAATQHHLTSISVIPGSLDLLTTRAASDSGILTAAS